MAEIEDAKFSTEIEDAKFSIDDLQEKKYELEIEDDKFSIDELQEISMISRTSLSLCISLPSLCWS